MGCSTEASQGGVRWKRRRFSAWIYDTLQPYAQHLGDGASSEDEGHHGGKKKSDLLAARTIADLLRCDLLPACYVLAPEIRDLRRLLRYRSLVVQEAVRMKNRTAGLLMEAGTSFINPL